MNTYDKDFWAALDRLAVECPLIIDRPKGTAHPRFPHVIYPVDYGYLQSTASMDGSGIDVWKGSDENAGLDAVLCTIDLMKRDSEIKLLLNCTREEKQLIYHFHNESDYMKAILIDRKRVNK